MHSLLRELLYHYGYHLQIISEMDNLADIKTHCRSHNIDQGICKAADKEFGADIFGVAWVITRIPSDANCLGIFWAPTVADAQSKHDAIAAIKKRIDVMSSIYQSLHT